MTNSVLASLGDVTLMRVNFINLLISMYCHVASSFTCICWTYRRTRAALPSLELILSIIPVQQKRNGQCNLYHHRQRTVHELSILFAEFEHASAKPVNCPI